MNLNRFKKGFSKINPEHGLKSLAGINRTERLNTNSTTVRVKGHYIPANTDNAGKFFGLMAFIHACLYVVLLPCTIYAEKTMDFSPLAVFILGLTIVHGCAIFADSLRHSESPWARKGIMVFWISTIFWSLISVCMSLV